MAKAPGEKTKEIQAGKPAEAAAGAPAPHAAKSSPSSGGKSSKAPATMPGGCVSWGCKVTASRFNFCPEHYDHFKFGLIKKTGEPVPDYEKKIEHYMAHQKGRSTQKVA